MMRFFENYSCEILLLETINDLSLNAGEHIHLTFQRHWRGLMNDTGGHVRFNCWKLSTIFLYP